MKRRELFKKSGRCSGRYDRMKKILMDAADIGNVVARAISYFPRDPGSLTYGKDSAWVMAYTNKDTTFTRNGAYRLDPRVLFHFGYICVSPAMAVTVPGKGSDYAMAMLDSKQRPQSIKHGVQVRSSW